MKGLNLIIIKRNGGEMKEYPETHQQGIISIENKELIFDRSNDLTEIIKGDIGIQISKDGRIWICINGIAFIRFKSNKKGGKENEI